MTHTCDIATVGETGTAIEKRSEETQTLLPTNQAKNFRPAVDPLPGGAGRPKFNQLGMVTTFTYKPGLVKIDAHISSYRGNRPTHTQTQTHTGAITIHCAAA